MPGPLSWWELAILLLLLLLIFGPKRLPEMGRSLGKGIREFKESITSTGKDDEPDEPPAELPPAEEEPVTTAPSRRKTRPRQWRGGCCRGGSSHGEEATLVEHLGELRAPADRQPASRSGSPSRSSSRSTSTSSSG